MNYIPTRQCVVCKNRFAANTLIRIRKEGDIIGFNMFGGRSVYVCKNCSCIDKCIKSHALDRAFRTKVDEGVYNTLRNMEK